MVKDHLRSTLGIICSQGSLFCSTVQIFNHTLCGSTPLCRPFKGVQPQGYMSGQ